MGKGVGGFSCAETASHKLGSYQGAHILSRRVARVDGMAMALPWEYHRKHLELA